jgi:putative transposase
MKELSKRHDFEIIEWNVAIDHVHMLLKIPPKYSVSSIV